MLIITFVSHGYNFLNLKVKCLNILTHYEKEFKIQKSPYLSILGCIMGENLRILNLPISLINVEFIMTSSLLIHLRVGVVERKNKTLQEMANTMLNKYLLPKYF